MELDRRSFISEYDVDNSSEQRFSVASIISDVSAAPSEKTSECEDDNVKISCLCKYAFDFFRQHYENDFCTFCTEINSFESEIIAACQKITSIVCKQLHIGIEPSKTCTLYQPLIFNPNVVGPFFYEFHSHVIYLFSQTKHQMKARSKTDFDKIFYILDKKVQLVLMKKSKNFKELGKHFAEISYDKVMKKWQDEHNEKLKRTLAKNPCVLQLKEQLIAKNKRIVFKQRMRIMKEGAYFPIYHEKKMSGEVFVQLSSNERELALNETDQSTKQTTKQIYLISDITHLAEGTACIQVKNKLVKEYEKNLAFSIIVKNDTFLNFKAPDRKTAKHWIDGLNLLLNKTNLSTYYIEELDKLVEMDLKLQLIELQNVRIPEQAPPVPKLPIDLRPVVPPKPKYVKQRKAAKLNN